MNQSSIAQTSQWLKDRAYALGFSFVGIAQARELSDEARKLDAWLNRGYQGQMQYLENHFDKRIDPRKLVDGAKSVVSLMFNYFPPQEQQPDAPKLARYAYGKDYHYVLKHRLKTILYELEEQLGPINGRCFVDSAPVLERDWAKYAGLGWIGKNTLLINKQQGSYFFLAELILDVELAYDAPIKDYCGTCTRCIDACPTQAIAPEGYLLDASKCISYLTIELKSAIPTEFQGQFENWVFGCDICQEVCPWNRFSQAHTEPEFMDQSGLLDLSPTDWTEMTEAVFKQHFKHSAVKRTGYAGLMRNLAFAGYAIPPAAPDAAEDSASTS